MYRSVLNSVSLPSISVAKKPLSSAVFWALSSSLMASFALAEDDRASPSSALLIQEFSIPSQPLQDALIQIGRQSKMQVSVENALVKDVHSLALRGKMTLEQALSQVLNGTGLTYRIRNNMINVTPELSGESSSTEALRKVTVIGQEVRFGDAPAEPGGLKAEYQTTATKMAMSLRETPQAISVVTRDALDARMVKDLATAVELTPSVSSSADGEGTQGGPGMFGGQGKFDQKFTLRGQPTAVRSDGFLVGNNNLDLSTYERVEVVKGPAGFYGQGSLGGFINMVRKKPKDEFGASLTAEMGSFDTYRTEADITGSLNESGNLRGRLNFVYDDSGSFVDQINSQRVVFAPSIEAVVNEKTRILAQILYQKDRFDANPGIPLELVGDQLQLFSTVSSPKHLYGTTADKSETENAEILLRVDHEISDRWLASVLLQKNKSTRDAINPNYLSNFDGNLYVGAGKDIWERDYWAGELRLEGKYDAFGETHQLLVGLEKNGKRIFRDWGWTTNYATGTIGPADQFDGDFSRFDTFSIDEIPSDVKYDSDNNSKAVYAQTLLTLNKNAKVLIGGRFDKVAQSIVARDGGSYSNTKSSDAFTGKVGLTYTLNQNLTAYAVVAESFEPSWGTSIEGPLDPITGTGHEIGFKTEWFDQKLGVNVAIYRQELSNRPLEDPNDTRFQIASGKHLTKGFELEVSGSPYPGWTLAAAYSLTDNEFVESGDPYDGLSINGSVDQQIGLYSHYEIQQGQFKGLGIGATFVHVGDRNFVNTDQAPYEQNYLDGYNRLDLNFSYNAIPNWDLNLLVRNLTDETYVESAYKRGSGNYFGSPVAALFNATYKF